MFFSEQKANELLEQNCDLWFKDPNLVYIAVVKDDNEPGDKQFRLEKGIKKDNTFSSSFYHLQPKVSKDGLHIPKSLERDFHGQKEIGTDIAYVGVAEPQITSEHHIRPLIAASAVQNIQNTRKSGTLGGLLSLKDNHNADFIHYFMIGNYHVLADVSNRKNYGKLMDNSLIFQPGLANSSGSVYENVIGELVFSQYGKSPMKENSHIPELDVGFVKINHSIKAKNRFLWEKVDYPSQNFAIEDIDTPKYNEMVYKYGAWSGYSENRLKSINATVRVTNIFKGEEPILFRNQILTKKMSIPGDSGSLLVNKDKKAVGLLHAGDGANYSVANNINHIFDAYYYDASYRHQEYKTKIKLNKFLT